MKKPVSALKAVSDDFDDLIASELDNSDDYEDAASSVYAGVEPVSLDDTISNAQSNIEDAVDHVINDMFDDWSDAEAFYDGQSDVPREKGRSQVTKTVVRDVIRALKPSAMRVMLQSDAIVAYGPYNVLNYTASQIAAQQTAFVNQLFWNSGGYKVLVNSLQNSFLKGVGIMKACYSAEKKDRYVKLSNVTPEQLQAIEQMPDVVVVEVEEAEDGTFFVEATHRVSGGQIKLSHVPLNNFFIDEDATGVEEGKYRICGERTNMTVSEAREMGLEYDDWMEFDAYDIETDEASTETAVRRRYDKTGRGQTVTSDESQHMFLLTEAYMKADMDGTGIAQLYRFWMGGTSYTYIDHERVEENPYGIGEIDPMPEAWRGRSIFNILREDQNTGTSLLRATCDNAHAANNMRLAYHETMVNSSDVNSKALGHPIRFRQPGMIQEIGVSPMVGAMLPLLQYLDMDSQTKAGATNASMGLDPDALQSTDKDAVRNTIQMAQGQIEFMVRNFAETGLKPIFDKLLRLSIRHNPRNQVVELNGSYVPIDQAMFNPELTMKTKVGLGMPDAQTQLMALEQIRQKQEQLIGQFGMQNPIAGIDKLFNTMADMAKLAGIPALGRYFSEITPDVAKMLDDQMAQAAENNRQEKPSEAIIAAENIKAQARIEEQRLENQEEVETRNLQARLKLIEEMMRDDFQRDKLAQDLELERAKIEGGQVDKMEIAREQDKKRDYGMQQFAMKQAQDREKFLQGIQMKRFQDEQQAQQMPPQATPQG